MTPHHLHMKFFVEKDIRTRADIQEVLRRMVRHCENIEFLTLQLRRLDEELAEAEYFDKKTPPVDAGREIPPTDRKTGLAIVQDIDSGDVALFEIKAPGGK